MDTLRSAAHLQRELGEGLFNILISSDHTDAVRQFAYNLAESKFPDTIKLGKRTYEILPIQTNKEESVNGSTMVERAIAMSANLGKGDASYIITHQNEIPSIFRGLITFIFPKHHNIDTLIDFVECVYYNNDRWIACWSMLENKWDNHYRLLRRKN